MCRTQALAEMGGGVNVQGRELLPANVVPRHYHVTLEPDLKKHTFDGTVVIDLDVAEDSKSISLHTLELDIHSAKITSGGKTVRSVCSLLPSLSCRSAAFSLVYYRD
jgi:aminopeptidase 2